MQGQAIRFGTKQSHFIYCELLPWGFGRCGNIIKWNEKSERKFETILKRKFDKWNENYLNGSECCCVTVLILSLSSQLCRETTRSACSCQPGVEYGDAMCYVCDVLRDVWRMFVVMRQKLLHYKLFHFRFYTASFASDINLVAVDRENIFNFM